MIIIITILIMLCIVLLQLFKYKIFCSKKMENIRLQNYENVRIQDLDLPELVSYYVLRLKSSEYFCYDLPVKAIPLLVDKFYIERSPEIEASILEVIWQFRRPESIEFLASLLDDQNGLVWKASLDGLVSIGGFESKEAIRLAIIRNESSKMKIEWFEEALEQISEQKTA
jgi:hypothetical protein